jgi:hypothetical protein
MGMNNDKNEAIVFNSRKCRDTWIVNDHVLTSSPECRLLGIQFHERNSSLHAMRCAAVKGRKALSALWRKLKDLNVGKNMALILRLYRILVEPVLLYGCEVWGSCLLMGKKQNPRDATVDPLDVESVQRNFLRGTLRLRGNTPAWIMYRETGMYPIQHAVLERMLKFVDRCFLLPSHEYVKLALIDNLHDYKENGTKNWSYCLFNFLNSIGHNTNHIHSYTQLIAEGNIDRIMTKWRTHYTTKIWSNLHPDPRTAPSENIKICTYHNWFAPPLPNDGQKWTPAPHIINHHIPYPHCTDLTKFRTSNHKLLIETLRGKIGRAARICTLCSTGAIQDEHHILFDCPHTELTQLRAKYPDLWMSEAESLNLRVLSDDPDKSGKLASLVHHIMSLTETLNDQSENT